MFLADDDGAFCFGIFMATMMMVSCAIFQIPQCSQQKRQYKSSAKSATSTRGNGIPKTPGGNGKMGPKSSNSRETSTEDRSKEKLQQRKTSSSTPGGKKMLPIKKSSKSAEKSRRQHQPVISESNGNPSSSKDDIQAPCHTAMVPLKKSREAADDKTQRDDTDSTDLK